MKTECRFQGQFPSEHPLYLAECSFCLGKVLTLRHKSFHSKLTKWLVPVFHLDTRMSMSVMIMLNCVTQVNGMVPHRYHIPSLIHVYTFIIRVLTHYVPNAFSYPNINQYQFCLADINCIQLFKQLVWLEYWRKFWTP